MKKESNLAKKTAAVVAASLAMLVGVNTVTSSENTDLKDKTLKSEIYSSNKQVKPQLVLSSNFSSLEYSREAGHTSHSSHSSHASHASHASSAG